MKKPKKEAWHVAWCREHADELLPYRGQRVALHPRHGILFARPRRAQLERVMETLLRAAHKKTAIVLVDSMLQRVGHQSSLERILGSLKDPEPDPFNNLPDNSYDDQHLGLSDASYREWFGNATWQLRGTQGGD